MLSRFSSLPVGSADKPEYTAGTGAAIRRTRAPARKRLHWSFRLQFKGPIRLRFKPSDGYAPPLANSVKRNEDCDRAAAGQRCALPPIRQRASRREAQAEAEFDEHCDRAAAGNGVARRVGTPARKGLPYGGQLRSEPALRPDTRAPALLPSVRGRAFRPRAVGERLRMVRRRAPPSEISNRI